MSKPVIRNRAEAHIWIATFAAALVNKTPDEAIRLADYAINALRVKEPELIEELNAVLAEKETR